MIPQYPIQADDAAAVARPDHTDSVVTESARCQTLTESLFHEPWWLSAATEGRCQEVKVVSRDQVVGRLPFVIVRKMGLTSLRMPPFTHLLGPAVDTGKGKAQTQLLRRMSIVKQLLDQLPPFDHFMQALVPTTADGLAFQDRGFRISPQYTFRIDCRRDLQEIWQEMHFKTRQHICRAEEKLDVTMVEDPDTFANFYRRNLEKLGRRNSAVFASFPTVFRESRLRQCGEILSANWPDGTPTAMVYIVWGHGTMYYLLSTRASDPGDNGSVNLLIWSAIKRAHSLGLVFDLDGVSTSGTARFLSGFGGRLEMRLIAQHSGLIYRALRGARRRFVSDLLAETRSFT
jgi:Acetyltransferase (GNAT) domain